MGCQEVQKAQMNNYDYIVAGTGASGLSLIVRMIHSGQFSNKKILLIDRALKNQNDRTWCFWEEEPGLFESIVFKKWTNLWFHGDEGGSKLHNIFPYQYKMIRGISFYEYCFKLIKHQNNISIEYGTVEHIHSDGKETYLTIDGQRFNAEYIFSSINPDDSFKNDGHYFLWQHFKGWFIRSEKPIFNPEEATFMDFRIDQHNDTRFVYVMPFNNYEALVEYTVFSATRISDHEYDEGLKDYCRRNLRLNDNEFSIDHEEFGMIPMTNYEFPTSNNNIIYIGSAGGKTKASSGYTFRFIQKHSEQIVNSLIEKNTPHINQTGNKFTFYDSVLLSILAEKKLEGAHIFTKLFENNKLCEVFKFLDNETSLGEDLKLISRLPKKQFISAAFSHLLK